MNYLIERENEEMLRTSVRRVHFPDGEIHSIEAYRLLWAWFDRIVTCDFGPTENELLDTVLNCSGEEKLPLNEALCRVIDYYVKLYESSGMDFTDHSLEVRVALEGIQRFHERKGQRKVS